MLYNFMTMLAESPEEARALHICVLGSNTLLFSQMGLGRAEIYRYNNLEFGSSDPLFNGYVSSIETE